MTPLLRHREKMKMKRGDVARELNINYAHLHRIEAGLQRPSPELANKIAKYFGNAVTRDQILYPEDYADVPVATTVRIREAS